MQEMRWFIPHLARLPVEIRHRNGPRSPFYENHFRFNRFMIFFKLYIYLVHPSDQESEGWLYNIDSESCCPETWREIHGISQTNTKFCLSWWKEPLKQRACSLTSLLKSTATERRLVQWKMVANLSVFAAFFFNADFQIRNTYSFESNEEEQEKNKKKVNWHLILQAV